MVTTIGHAVTPLCECNADGYCHRYARHMSGRFRELCAGVNVDVGTAAAFREQWAREAESIHGLAIPTATTASPRQLLLRTDQQVGDAVAMTAAIYSLHRMYPGKYLTAVESQWPEVFEHNPDVVPVDTLTDPERLHMHYPAVHQSNERAIHFMQGWCEHLGYALGVPVPLMTNRPRLYFAEQDAPPVKDYWLMCSGGKNNFTTKLWGTEQYQRVVDMLMGKVTFVQVGETSGDHPPLFMHKGSKSMVGKTNLRQLFDLCRRARGVLCGVSLLMHVAAALQVPAVVVAGGREPVAWNAYPRQQYVHTVGALPCASVQGHMGEACWRHRTIPLGDGTHYDRDPCERPVEGGSRPACMGLINPADVAALVLRYNQL